MPARLKYPATERNREPILAVLQRYLPQSGHVLEIASGSGEHVVYLAEKYKNVMWQPSDLDPACLQSIAAWTSHTGLENIYPPLSLDTTIEENWPLTSLDALICINMIHISPWEATIGLMKQAGRLLKEEGFLYLYGPYKQNGEHTAPSNATFEQWLWDKDARFGVRDMDDVVKEAVKNGLKLKEIVHMPANNFSLVLGRA